MARRGYRRMILDLTPMIDIIMILLFGVMINSVTRVEVTSQSFHEDLAKAEEDLTDTRRDKNLLADENDRLQVRLQQIQTNLSSSEGERVELARDLERQKRELARAMAKLLQMDDRESLRFREKLQELSQESAQRLEKILAELKKEQTPGKIFKAIRRIEEMQKVFTFIDLHIDNRNHLKVVGNGRDLAKLALAPRAGVISSQTIEIRLRDVINDLPSNQIILLLFSYEKTSNFFAVKHTEEGIRSLVRYYHNGLNARQLRFADIGRVPALSADLGKDQ